MDKDMMKNIKRGRFRENNATILRALNLLRIRFERLTDVKYALPELSEQEFLDGINYLSESGYIHLRRISTKEKALLADCDYKELEGKLSRAGIKILSGDETDNSIGVI